MIEDMEVASTGLVSHSTTVPMLKVHGTRRRCVENTDTIYLDHTIFSESPASRPANSEDLYRLINKVERDIGGDSGLIGMSGSVARLDLARIFKAMNIDLPGAHLLDVGSGLGRPMLHALLAGATQVSGVEFDSMKHRKAQTVISRVMPLSDQVRASFHHADVMNLRHFSQMGHGVTHLYSFWEGINIDAREVVARLATQEWQRGGKISHVAFVQEHVHHLESYMYELGFPKELRLVDSFPVTMIGGACKFRAYIFKFDTQVPDHLRPNFQVEISKAMQASRKRRPVLKNSSINAALSANEVILGDYVVERRRSRRSCQAEVIGTIDLEAIPIREASLLSISNTDAASSAIRSMISSGQPCLVDPTLLIGDPSSLLHRPSDYQDTRLRTHNYTTHESITVEQSQGMQNVARVGATRNSASRQEIVDVPPVNLSADELIVEDHVVESTPALLQDIVNAEQSESENSRDAAHEQEYVSALVHEDRPIISTPEATLGHAGAVQEPSLVPDNVANSSMQPVTVPPLVLQADEMILGDYVIKKRRSRRGFQPEISYQETVQAKSTLEEPMPEKLQPAEATPQVKMPEEALQEEIVQMEIMSEKNVPRTTALQEMATASDYIGQSKLQDSLAEEVTAVVPEPYSVSNSYQGKKRKRPHGSQTKFQTHCNSPQLATQEGGLETAVGHADDPSNGIHTVLQDLPIECALRQAERNRQSDSPSAKSDMALDFPVEHSTPKYSTITITTTETLPKDVLNVPWDFDTDYRGNAVLPRRHHIRRTYSTSKRKFTRDEKARRSSASSTSVSIASGEDNDSDNIRSPPQLQTPAFSPRARQSGEDLTASTSCQTPKIKANADRLELLGDKRCLQTPAYSWQTATMPISPVAIRTIVRPNTASLANYDQVNEEPVVHSPCPRRASTRSRSAAKLAKNPASDSSSQKDSAPVSSPTSMKQAAEMTTKPSNLVLHDRLPPTYPTSSPSNLLYSTHNNSIGKRQASITEQPPTVTRLKERKQIMNSKSPNILRPSNPSTASASKFNTHSMPNAFSPNTWDPSPHRMSTRSRSSSKSLTLSIQTDSSQQHITFMDESPEPEALKAITATQAPFALSFMDESPSPTVLDQFSYASCT